VTDRPPAGRDEHALNATLALSRADFAVLVQSHRNHWHSKLGGVPFIGSLALAWLGMTLAESRGWPTITHWLIFAVGWGVGLAMMSRVTTWMLRRNGLVCPSCGAPLADTLWPVGRDRAVLVSGQCPACKVALFPAEA
jgi:hypothetical protein